jgi:N-acetylmuramoyl-L-alanine amidase
LEAFYAQKVDEVSIFSNFCRPRFVGFLAGVQYFGFDRQRRYGGNGLDRYGDRYRENRADLVGGVSLDTRDDTLAAVLLDLSQGATMEASNAVAHQVHAAMRRVGPTHKNYVERANFVVLRSPDVPSILVETAFISNPAEEKRLNNPVERTKLAEAILDGIRNYFRMTPPPGTWFAANSGRQKPNRHVVSRGETLSLIAARHGTSVSALRNVNKLAQDAVRVGDVLEIPQG